MTTPRFFVSPSCPLVINMNPTNQSDDGASRSDISFNPMNQSGDGHDGASSSYDSVTSSESSSVKRKLRVFSERPKWSLPYRVSEWKRKHAEKVLGIFYSKRVSGNPEDLLKVISGTAEELSEQQKEYIEFINKHLTFNLSLQQFYLPSDTAEEEIMKCKTNIELLQAKQKTWSWSVMKLKVFIRGVATLLENIREYKKKRAPYEGFVTSFIGKFADLCCLDVEYCNQAHQVTWENLKGIKVSSTPDLRLFKFGVGGYCTKKLVSVTEAKSDSYYNPEPMGPPKKKSKGSPRFSSSDNDHDSMSKTTAEEAIEIPIHDRVLGQHAGELLLDLHKKYENDEEKKFEDGKKINMLGMIADGTSNLEHYFSDQKKRRDQWKQASKNYYNKEENRSKKKQTLKMEYAKPDVAHKKKTSERVRYQIPKVANKQKLLKREKYKIPEVANEKKKSERVRYQIPKVANKQKLLKREKYKIPEVANEKKKSERVRYQIPKVANKQKLLKREKYKIPEVANEKKKSERVRYQIPKVANKQKLLKREKYKIPEVANEKKKSERVRYQIPKVANKQKVLKREKYKIPEVANEKKKSERVRYQIPKVANKQKLLKREKYKIPEVANEKKKSERVRYQIPKVANKQKLLKREKYKIPEVANEKKKSEREKYKIPEVAHKKKTSEKEKYKIPEVANKQKLLKREKYKIPEIGNRQKLSKKLRYNVPTFAYSKLKDLRSKYSNDKLFRQRKIDISKRSAARKKSCMSNEEQCIITFRIHCKQFPIFKCIVCGRLLFKNQVIQLKKDKYNDKQYAVVQQCVNKNQSRKKKTWICITCQRHVRMSKVPPQALINNMEVPDIPEEVQVLNILERHLISPVIAFMKIVILPKSSQKGIHGPVICVNSDVLQVMKVLPRPLSEDTLIKVKLKRKLSYKGHHLYQQVHPQRVFKALQLFKENNPLFKDITVDESKLHVSDISDSNNLITESLDEVCDEKSDPQTPLEDSNEAPQITETNEPVNNVENNDENEVNSTTAPLVSSLQPVDLSQHVADMYEDQLISMAPAEKHTPIPALKHEAHSFPYHFIDSSGTFVDHRNVKLTLKRYFNARLFSSDKRFASDPQYIFFAQCTTEVNDICSSISIAMRKSSSKDISLQEIRSAESLRKVLKNDEGFRFLQSIRGSPMYWERAMRDAFAMLRQIGLPAFFITLSAADRRWPEMIESICAQTCQPIPEDMDWTAYCNLINSNIVTATRMFDKRLKYFINDVLKSPSHPVGQVVDMFGRIEFQARGWPHYHGLLWIKDSPNYCESDQETVRQFIDQYITSTLPSSDDKELYDIVTSVQMHTKKHTQSCRKGGKECRFNFPRPPSLQTFVAQRNDCSDENAQVMTNNMATTLLHLYWTKLKEKEDTTISTSQLLTSCGLTQELFESAFNVLSKKPMVIYKRQPKDCWVNGYNATLLKAWNGNMDIQYVTDPYSCIMYIISYMTKSERELSQTIKTAQKEARSQDNPDAISELRNLGHIYMTHRDVSVMESVYRVCGLPLKLSTRDVVWIPSDPESTRLTLPLHILKQQNPESEKIWMTNIIDRYYARPLQQDFQNMCLADFASSYRVLPKTSSKGGNQNQQKGISLLDDMGFIVKRKGKPAVIRYPRFQLDKDPERYYANVLCLFLPHRNNLKPNTFPLFEDYFKNGFVNTDNKISEIVTENMGKYEQLKENFDEAWEEMKDLEMESSWGIIAPSTENEREDFVHEDFDETEIVQIPELSVPKSTGKTGKVQAHMQSQSSLDNDIVSFKLKSMNEKQQQVFNFVRSWCVRKATGENPEPFFVFINGGAGTGKSHLIHCIHYEASHILQRGLENPDDITVLLSAYTGTAAFNILGRTVHSSFAINSTTLPYQSLGEDSLNTLRSNLHNISILIIDEVSMISKPLLEYVNGRLQQIKKHFKSKPFGNVSVLVVGDFYQIPPVYGKILYNIDTGAIPVDLWTYFHIFNLTEVMRQRDDLEFANMLNRIRNKLKNQEMNQEDEKMLKSRLVLDKYPTNALHIFATNKLVNEHNTIMLNKLSSDIVCLEASDIVTCKSGKSYRRKTADINLQSSLPSSLEIAEGARVMLTTNKDVGDGLVNGVTGTVFKIVKGKLQHNLPEYICVKFDNPVVGSNLRMKFKNCDWVPEMTTPISFSSQKVKQTKLDITRHMYPLTLSWACTIHKVQGQTFQEVVISMNGIFRAGMAYVALSRATHLKGLHLLDFDKKVIYADPSVEDAMKSMQHLDVWKANPLYQNKEEDFTIVHHNIQSLHAHYEDLKNNKELQYASIICLTEAWLCDTKKVMDYSLNGYSFYPILPKSSVCNKSSGIVLYLKDVCKHEIIDCPSTPELEISTVILHEPFKTLLAIVYRHPNTTSSLIDSLAKKLVSMSLSCKVQSILVMGDFNEDITKQQHPLHDSFINLGYVQVINVPTTISGSCIDHIYLYKVNTSFTCGLLSTYYSYHEPIYITFKSENGSVISTSKSEEISKETKSGSSDMGINQSRVSMKRKSTSKHVTITTKVQKLDNKHLVQHEPILGYEPDSFTPKFPLPANYINDIPEEVHLTAKNGFVRIVDMWGGNQNVFHLSKWLTEIGLNVIETITNEQVGPSCGYIAAHVAWLLHNNSEWRSVDVSGALDPAIVSQYNVILNQAMSQPTYLTDNQILDVLTHLQYSQSRSRNLHWIHGPMPLNYLIQFFRNHFRGAKRRTRSQEPKIFIVNTTPVANIQLNLTQNTRSGDHWIVLAAYLQ